MALSFARFARGSLGKVTQNYHNDRGIPMVYVQLKHSFALVLGLKLLLLEAVSLLDAVQRAPLR